jgi:hypothetical protein
VAEVIIERTSRSGDGIAYAGYVSARTREQRALRLFERRGHQIEQAGENLFYCPSWDGTTEHVVRYGGEEESCDCPDHIYRGSTCMHLLAVAIRSAKRRARSRRNAIAAVAGANHG